MASFAGAALVMHAAVSAYWRTIFSSDYHFVLAGHFSTAPPEVLSM